MLQGSAVALLARGALLGARGNSGVILSQVLRGLVEPLLADTPRQLATLDRVVMTDAMTATRCGVLTRDRAAAPTQLAAGRPAGFLGILGDQVVLLAWRTC